MGHRLLTINVNDGDVEMAKAKGINLSAFFREALNTELVLKDILNTEDPKKQITLLKNKISFLSQEIDSRTKEIEHLKKDIILKNEKIETLKSGIDGKVIWTT